MRYDRLTEYRALEAAARRLQAAAWIALDAPDGPDAVTLDEAAARGLRAARYLDAVTCSTPGRVRYARRILDGTAGEFRGPDPQGHGAGLRALSRLESNAANAARHCLMSY